MKGSRASWYPYYAGFSPNFAQSLLTSAKLKKGAFVLDPWNGGGTTTASASILGIESVGSDLNPVMIIAARAYLLSRHSKSSLLPLAVDISRKASRSKKRTLDRNEPLLVWFQHDTALYIRSLERAIQHLLIDSTTCVELHKATVVESLSDIASFALVALFRTTRQLLKSFYSSNPTWLKKPKEDKQRIFIDNEMIASLFKSEMMSMSDSYSDIIDSPRHAGNSSLFVSPAEQLPITDESTDFVLTSPPYCTRIDYAVATMAELAVLGFDLKGNFQDLRRSLTGTSTISGKTIVASKSWGNECNSFLERVESHASVSSVSYYKKNHLQYFDSIFKSLGEIKRVMKPASLCSIVVQDSHYKDVHNDLPRIFVEMSQSLGLELVRRDDFRMSQTMAGINPEVKKYRTKIEATESVLTFVK